ncbi:Coatomer subunit delta, partial [Sarcoptes scabiei]
IRHDLTWLLIILIRLKQLLLNLSFPLDRLYFKDHFEIIMVLLASAVISKQNGKILLSRQFVEMSRSRIEGVLTAFYKLITKDKQHTFIETDTVRYVYQALMDKLYCVLITTKTSNILEDLETLRLFVRVINEYTTTNKVISDEQAILDNAFTLIFAFDEIVALGYRENVNMSQVRTFIEMDSNEERVFEAVRKTQEREAKQKMREKAKELRKLQRTQQNERMKMSSMGNSISSSNYSNNAVSSTASDFDSNNIFDVPKSTLAISQAKSNKPSKALKLGSKNQNIFAPAVEEQLSTELKEETTKTSSKTFQPEPVHITVEEKLSINLSRDGAINSSELTGVLYVHVRDERHCKVKFLVDFDDSQNVQIQSHPNVDKELFRQQGLITLKQKSFPLNMSVGVLKFRRMTQSANDWPPLSINCWPNGNNCNLELIVNRSLTELAISIPCPSQPTVNECSEGDYEYKRGLLIWNISMISPDSQTATIDFDLSKAPNPDEYFPITCIFNTSQSLAGLIVKEVINEEVDEDVKWSFESKLKVDKYEIV